MVSFWFHRLFNACDSSLWTGMTEIHSHILPGVDDGVETKVDALSLLGFMEKEVKVQRVFITPHTMMDFNNSPAGELQKKFTEFKSAYGGQMELVLASEYMLDKHFPCRLSEGVLPLGEWNQKKLLLVEGAGIVLLPGFYDMLEECFEAGYTPVIAHPERYPYLEKNDYIKLKERGCLFQLNIPSLHGYYGKHVRQAAFTLLDKGMYEFAGFDIHRYEGYAAVVRQLCLTRKRLDKLGELLANNKDCLASQ